MVQRTLGRRVAGVALFCLLLCGASTAPVLAAPEYRLSKGQTVYVAVYASIFSAPRKIPYKLTSILSIRNTDLAQAITVAAADYYDSKGRLVRRYYPAPVSLGPLESMEIYIPDEEITGGPGANFIVRWQASREVNAPIIECVMLGMKSGQGISFVSAGQEIKEPGR